jgi:hypothetical protein
VDGLHPSGAGSIAASKAFLTALQTAYPAAGTSAGSQAGAPTYNNWYAAKGFPKASTYGSGLTVNGYTPAPLPGVMAGASCLSADAAGRLQVWVNGVENAVGSGGLWYGVVPYAGLVSGGYNCATGAWSITWSASKPASGAIIAIDEDPANLLLNGLLDSAQVTPVTPATISGLTPPGGWALTVPANLASALATGACAGNAPPCGTASLTPTTITDLDGTWPAYQLTFAGTLTAVSTLKLTNTLSSQAALIAVGDKLRAIGYSAIGSNGGHLFGLYGLQADLGTNVSSGTFQAYAAYPNVNGPTTTTSLNCIGAAGVSVYPFSDLMLTTWNANFGSTYGPMILQPAVSHLCDTTGMPGIGSTRMDYQIGLSAGPNSFTAILYRAGLYIRTR